MQLILLEERLASLQEDEPEKIIFIVVPSVFVAVLTGFSQQMLIVILLYGIIEKAIRLFEVLAALIQYPRYQIIGYGCDNRPLSGELQ